MAAREKTNYELKLFLDGERELAISVEDMLHEQYPHPRQDHVTEPVTDKT